MLKTESINLRFALAYVQQLNFKIFPINYKSKTPMTKNGFKDATDEIEQIKDWFTLYPNAGIGLPTGEINNIIVLDVDPRNGGDVSLSRLVDKHGGLPHTVECLTAGGGNHYYFKYDKRINSADLKRFGYPGLDIQSDGRYVVLPPSTHPNGKQYHWEEASKPVYTEFAEVPNFLIDLFKTEQKKVRYKATPSNEYVKILQGVQVGERNNSMMSLIGHLIALNMDYREVYEIVHMWNESRCNPPLEPNIVTRAINNILKSEQQKR